MEHSLRGKNFGNLNDIQNQLDDFFASKPEGFYKTGIEKLPGRWQKVLENEMGLKAAKINVTFGNGTVQKFLSDDETLERAV